MLKVNKELIVFGTQIQLNVLKEHVKMLLLILILQSYVKNIILIVQLITIITVVNKKHVKTLQNQLQLLLIVKHIYLRIIVYHKMEEGVRS